MTTIDEHRYSYADLAAKASELKAMLPANKRPSLADEDLREILESLTRSVEVLLRSVTLSGKQKGEALSHAAGKKITAFTDKHPDAFNADYFRSEFKRCFRKGLRAGLTEPHTPKDLRDAVICYHYFTSKTKKRERLVHWLGQLESHLRSRNDGLPEEGLRDKKEALQHHESLQMLKFTKERSRKSFFSPEYFQQKIENLPAEIERAARSETQAFKDPREALIFSMYFGSPRDGREAALQALREEIEADFNRDPQVKRTKWMKDLCIDLMIREEPQEIHRELVKAISNPDELAAFARVNRLKMPRLRKTAPNNEYIWEGLTEQIHKKGALARMKVR
ncbi:MAG: hypothetical protein AB1646_03820 [Thermodesulfobacteriota bacterium]